MLKIGTIIVVGGGRMGQAMLRGWSKDSALKKTLAVIEPSEENAAIILKECDLKAVPAIPDITILQSLPKPVLLVLAVKPQMLDAVLLEYGKLKPYFDAVISIAAGKDISFYEKYFGAEMPIYRTMPNLPAVVGQAYTYIVENDAAKTLREKTGAEYADVLFKQVGDIFSGHGNEDKINAVTAITGSGPAYLYSFMEAWIKAAEQLGFTRQDAEKMVRQTTQGALQLLQQANQSEVELARQVTSPGGTTEAALKVFAKDDRLNSLMTEALAAAIARAEELK
jgi:pyrroline-5-carboxylate reductase